MVNETSLIKIDDDLVLDVNTGLIGSRKNKNSKTNLSPSVSFEEINDELDKLEQYINDLEESLDPHTTSRLSYSSREGIYEKEGLLTNIVLGVIIALVLIILLL